MIILHEIQCMKGSILDTISFFNCILGFNPVTYKVNDRTEKCCLNSCVCGGNPTVLKCGTFYHFLFLQSEFLDFSGS